jgi:sulfur carrier protein
VIVTLNGERHEAADGSTIASLVESLGAERRGVAVALGGEVVPRGRWADTGVAEGDRVEVVAAIQGG